MPNRRLRIAKKFPLPAIGVCERCNAQFKSLLPQEDKAEWEISTLFTRHKCKLVDSSQNALRIVRESTEAK